MLFGEILTADGVVAFLSEQLIEFLLRFTFESLGNTAQAFIWPALVIERSEGAGIVGLLLLYWLFPRFIKAPLSRWLIDEGKSDAPA